MGGADEELKRLVEELYSKISGLDENKRLSFRRGMILALLEKETDANIKPRLERNKSPEPFDKKTAAEAYKLVMHILETAEKSTKVRPTEVIYPVLAVYSEIRKHGK